MYGISILHLQLQNSFYDKAAFNYLIYKLCFVNVTIIVGFPNPLSPERADHVRFFSLRPAA